MELLPAQRLGVGVPGDGAACSHHHALGQHWVHPCLQGSHANMHEGICAPQLTSTEFTMAATHPCTKARVLACFYVEMRQ